MSKSLSKNLVRFIAMLLLASFLVSCAPVSTPPVSTPPAEPTPSPAPSPGEEGEKPVTDEKVVIKIPFGYEPSSLDTGFGNSTDSICPRGLMFEGLVRIFDN